MVAVFAVTARALYTVDTVNLATRDIYKGANYPGVKIGDAFDLTPGGVLVSVKPQVGEPVERTFPADGVHAVIGNPPFLGQADDPAALTTALHRLDARPPHDMGGNLAAWFALLAAALSRPDGRWALVLPTGVLQNGNLAPWRRWLRANFDVVVWHAEDDVWFSDARVATCVVLAIKSNAQKKSLHFVDVRERVQGRLTAAAGVPSPTANAVVRDLSGLDAGADIYIAGAYPDALDRFRQSSKTQPLGTVDGVSIFSGNKLGHAMYQLRDLAPGKAGVLRDVEAQQMKFRLNRAYLLPMLRSPMDERTGEFRQSEYWALAAPATVPASGALRTYIENCKRLGVHKKPSVKQRGTHWWSADWRAAQVAVQIHPGFLHQVWWSSEPFVAKNNFHVLQFDARVPTAERELLAACLASGFGALAALYVSSEVGCEGVRWLSTDQFSQWPVLSPSAVSREHSAAILGVYRLFRRLKATEIHLMDRETQAAWLELTAAVAAAAGLADPQSMAAQVLEVARQTCVRRAERETLALAGRMRTSIRGGTFARHIHTRLESSPAVPPLLERLTGGDRVIRLRSAEPALQGSLDLGLDTSTVPGEEALGPVLGEDFECAPTSGQEADPGALAREVAAVLDSLVEDLVGQPPPGNEAGATHRELALAIRRTAVGWLQGQVHQRLH